ncbi:MAG: Spy/CpxP family protein refolding chaperone [Limisphaerales bacterium]
MNTFKCLLLSLVVTVVAEQGWARQNREMGLDSRFFPMLGRLLTDQQRLSLFRNIDAQRSEIQPLRQKIRASRAALLNQIVSGKFNEKLTRQYAAQSAGAQARLTVIFITALSQMQPPLSRQQAAQLKNFQPGRFVGAREEAEAPAPVVHLKLPPPLPTDTNGLPIVN